MKPKIILAAMILSGSTQVLAAPAPVSEAASSQSSIEKRLASLENMMQSRNLLQVELQQQLNLLQDEVSQIRGVTEEQSYKLEKVDKNTFKKITVDEAEDKEEEDVFDSDPEDEGPEDVCEEVIFFINGEDDEDSDKGVEEEEVFKLDD